MSLSIPQLALRASQFFWTLLTTALIGNVIAESFAGNPSSINFAIFVCVLSWIVLFIGIAALKVDLPAMILMVLDGLATLFTFIAGVVLAAKLGVHSCGNKVSFLQALTWWHAQLIIFLLRITFSPIP